MRYAFLFLVGLSLIGAITGHARQEKIPPNRCLPGQSCFPSREALKTFASTLTGSLVQPSDSDYSRLVTMKNTRLTRHPYIIVVAGDVGDIQKAMHFARKHQLMVSSQTSTGDFSGRSSYDGSLLINLSQMTGVNTVESTTRSPNGEITAQAAATWEQLYVQARLLGNDVVATAGLTETVGDTVGDGGIGPLVKVYGLVGDSLLEATMVTADGSLVTVTEYTVTVDYGKDLVRKTYDRSLFAAITGGGIGTWGVVTSYTFKMYPSPPSIVTAQLRYNLWEAGTYVGADILQFLLDTVASLPDKWGGYIYLDGATSDTLPNTKGQMVVSLAYYGSWRADADFDFINQITAFPASTALVESQLVNRTSILDFERLQPVSNANVRFYSFNVLFQPAKMAEIPDATEKVREALLFVLNNPTIDSTFGCAAQLLGGASYEDSRNFSLVNPAIRTAVVSMSCGLIYPGNGLDDSFYIDRALDFAELFEPFGYGKHRYYAEEDLPDWKHQFHGDAYGDLIETKIRYDIDNFLWCHNCVGSDFRVDCRYNDQHKGLMLSGYVSSQRANRARNKAREDRTHRVRSPYIQIMSHD